MRGKGITQNYVPKRIYYRIADVAEQLNMSKSAIRRWCSYFNINPKRNGHGDRRFSPSEFESMKYLHHLIYTERYTIEGAKIKFNEWLKLESKKTKYVTYDQTSNTTEAGEIMSD